MDGIKRIAIVTTAEHSCGLYLAATLAELDLDVCVFSQVAPKCPEHSWPYLKRLLKRRGVFVFLDNVLLTLSERIEYSRLGGLYSRCPPSHDLKYDWPVLNRDEWAARVAPSRIVRMTNVNSEDGVLPIRRYSPDLILLAGAPILTRRVLTIARHGVLNPHCGISPGYAGSSPTVWPLYDDRPFDIGYTIHFVIPEVDAGPIVEQVRLPWRSDWSFAMIASYVLQVMYERLVTIVQQWVLSGIRPLSRPQTVTKVRPPAGYFAYRIAERNKAQLNRQGMRFVIPTEWQGDFCISSNVGGVVFGDLQPCKITSPSPTNYVTCRNH